VPPESPSGSLQFLSAAPELPIFDKAGKKTDLAKQKGKIFIVHFWATWCPPCVEEIPALSRFWDKYRTREDVELYAVSVDKDWKIIDDFMAKNPSTIRLFLDPGAATAKRFGTTQYPRPTSSTTRAACSSGCRGGGLVRRRRARPDRAADRVLTKSVRGPLPGRRGARRRATRRAPEGYPGRSSTPSTRPSSCRRAGTSRRNASTGRSPTSCRRRTST
jgi:thiol-disulfide isomerase/thioredoxin